MLHEKHDLLHELPEHKETIKKLQQSNKHFEKLLQEYDALDHEIQQIELAGENTSDEYLESQKKQRLRLKDELFELIKNA